MSVSVAINQPTFSDLSVQDTDGVFQPTELSDLFIWFRTKDAYTLDMNGDAVSDISDRSPSRFDLAQSIGSLQPPYGAKQLNGSQLISFTGTENLRNFSIGDFDTCTIFILATQLDSGESNQGMFDFHTSAGGTNTGVSIANFANPEDMLARILTSGGLEDLNTTLPSLPGTHIFEILVNGSILELFLDGVSQEQIITTAVIDSVISRLNLGQLNVGGFNGIFDFAELIVYSAGKSSIERGKIRKYLRTDWGL